MKTFAKMVCTLLVLVAAGWSAFQALRPVPPSLPSMVPEGALLYLEARDFSSLLREWNASPEKRAWLTSDNYATFSRSRLFLRLKEAQEQFASGAGLPPDMKFLAEVAGRESAFAWYDIGKLRFLYITHLPSSNAMQSALWQSRNKFEPRKAGNIPFFVRTDPESQRVVAFAVTDDFLVIATQEDLMAGALSLMAGQKGRNIRDEKLFSDARRAAGLHGDLRMIINLEGVVPTYQFRTYWIQQNITEMKNYRAVISDLYRSAGEYREERVLLRQGEKQQNTAPAAPPQGVADLVRLVPQEAGFYRAVADPTPDAALNLLQQKILSPRLGPPPVEKLAPNVSLTGGEVGSGSDLESRIDIAPVARVTLGRGSGPMRQQLEKARLQGMLQLQSTRRNPDGVFVGTRSALVFLSSEDWDSDAVRRALQDALAPGLTTAQLGVGWQARQKASEAYYELDGLTPLLLATRGPYLIVADDAQLLLGVISNFKTQRSLQPAVYAAGFNHAQERDNFAALTALIDRPNIQARDPKQGRYPEFFSENIASLSAVLAAVRSQSVVVRESGDRVLHTVTYQWRQ